MNAPGTRSAENGPGEAAPRARRAAHGGWLARGVRLVTVTLITIAFVIPVGAVWARVAEARGPQTDQVGIVSGSADGTPVADGLGGPQATPTSTSLPLAGPGRLADPTQSTPTAGMTPLPRPTSPAVRAPGGTFAPGKAPAVATTGPTFGPTPGPSPRPSPGPTLGPSFAPLPTVRPTPALTVSPTPTPTPDPTATPSPAPSTSGWVTVVNDQFGSGTLPTWWHSYDGPYPEGAYNCAVPSHAVVSGGVLHLLMSYEASGSCGAGWYTAGLALSGFSAVDQRVTVRLRVVDEGVSSHFIIPMRWPDVDSSWPAGGEEDYCESDAPSGCTTNLLYGASPGGPRSLVEHPLAVDLTQWHTLRFQRLNHVVEVYADDMTTPTWTYTGSSTTLPDTLKHVVLQQECRSGGCPSGTTGSEDIQIDWITVDNPS